jgi:hypothetical protein
MNENFFQDFIEFYIKLVQNLQTVNIFNNPDDIIDNFNFKSKFSANAYCYVLIGYKDVWSHTVYDRAWVRPQNITFIEAWVHPKFSINASFPSMEVQHHDLAILILAEEIKPNTFLLGSAAVATLADVSDDQADDQLNIVGWGESRPLWVEQRTA